MTRHDNTTRQRRRHVGDGVAVVLAVAAFASSLRHVQTVAADHGQGGWIAWSIAVGTELVALAGILELRRAKDEGYRPVVGWACLTFGLVMSGGANLATASGPGWFWSHAMAVAPVIEYLLVVVMVETRPGRSLGRRRRVQPPVVKPEPRPEPAPVAAERLHAVPEPRGQRATIDEGLLAAVAAGEMTQKEAAEAAGVSVRTFQRRSSQFTSSHVHAAVSR